MTKRKTGFLVNEKPFAKQEDANKELLRLKNEKTKKIVYIDERRKEHVIYSLERKNYNVRKGVYTPESIPESITVDGDNRSDSDSVPEVSESIE